MKKLSETNLPQNYSKFLFEDKCFDLAPEHLDKMYDILFTGTSTLLKKYKSMKTPTVFSMSELNGNFIAAGIVQYFENEDPSQPGNFSLVWTFDKNDIPEGSTIITLEHNEAFSEFMSTGGSKYGIKFNDNASATVLLHYAMYQLKKWLDENAKEGSVVGVYVDGVFQARVEVQNGEKVFAIEPYGEIKNLIKDDKAIER